MKRNAESRPLNDYVQERQPNDNVRYDIPTFSENLYNKSSTPDKY